MRSIPLLLCLIFLLVLSAGAGDVFIREEFDDLDAWKPLFFKKIVKFLGSIKRI